MCYKDFVDYIVPLIGLIVSIMACVYTCLTYRKSRDILEVVDKERRYRWNQKELKKLFRTLSFESIDCFFNNPDIIRDELWEGLRAVDLSTFQYDGKDKEIIQSFIQGLNTFSFMRYKQTPSNHWKYQPLVDNEPYDAAKERRRMKDLHEKVAELKPLYEKVKRIFIKYHIDVMEINQRALDFYNKLMEEKMRL